MNIFMIILLFQDTVTHTSNDPKTSVSVTWSPPAVSGADDDDDDDEYQVVWSVVQDYNNYWVRIQSEEISVVRQSDHDDVSSPTTTTKHHIIHHHREDEKHNHHHEEIKHSHDEEKSEDDHDHEEKSVDHHHDHHVYDGCGVNKTCFGLVNSCQDSHDCDILATWSMKQDVMIVELYSSLGSNNRYAALGVSSDDRMGDDLVLGCVSQGGEVEVVQSWNTGRTNVPMIEQFANMKMISGANVDGELYCRLHIDNYIEVSPPLAGARTQRYDLTRDQYHVLLSSGHTLPGGVLTYHGGDMTQVTSAPVSLSRVSSVGVKRGQLLVKCHSMIMIIAWLGCAGSGLILARYYKHTWRDADCCGQAQWFLWHRLLMFLVWAGTIAGVVIIFIDLGGWPYSLMFIMTNPHPILGLATLGLTFIQPLMAMCRPSPVSPLRWMFNWCHWFVGNCAQVC